MKCYDFCKEKNVECPLSECRYWIKHSSSKNCTFGAIEKANGPMTLEEVSFIMKVTPARISQIQKEALEKIKNTSRLQVLQ